MKIVQACSGLRISFLFWLAISVIGAPACHVEAQTTTPSQSRHKQHSAPVAGTRDVDIPAILVSDIHFDPFHDPAKLQQLVAAPVSQWKSILAAPPSPNQPLAFDALQAECQARGVDTPYSLFESSLNAMHAQRGDAKFLTVSGDLIAHGFICRFQKLLPKASSSEYQAFALKTIQFVVKELLTTFPGVPVYIAFGNNDSGCGDYRLDARNDFLAQAGKILAEGLPSSQRQDAIQEFADGGYYSVEMTAPIGNTRLIVINDTLLSPKYTSCGGLPNPSAGDPEIAWLKKQLEDARQAHQQAWVMGHIPPGVDVYSTLAKMMNICAKAKPDMFLSSDAMADLMIEYADVIRLGIFAHSHMDELRLLQSKTPSGESAEEATSERGVAIKIVPSISPVDGNNPSFTIAHVNGSSGILQDYEVIAASNQSGVETTWSREYDYRETYGATDFSTVALKRLIEEFKSDRNAEQPVSKAYLRDFFVGDRSLQLKLFWPQYVCGLSNATGRAFADCACSAGK